MKDHNMNRADVTRLARKAGMSPSELLNAVNAIGRTIPIAWLEVFANLVEAEALKAHQQAIEAAVLAEREACARLCDKFKEGSLAAQSGSPDALTNIMLRQVAELGHSECADAIRARTQPMRIEDAHKED